MASFGLSSPASSTTAPQHPIGGPVDISMAYSAVSEGNLPLLQWTMNKLQTQTVPASSSSSNNLTYTTLSDEHGYTLLHAAASYNQVAIIEFLLAQTTGPDEIIAFLTIGDTDDGDTALHYAGTMAAAKCLLEAAIASTTASGRSENAGWSAARNITRIFNKHGQTALYVKQEELKELQQDEEIEEDDIELEILQELITYLTEWLNFITPDNWFLAEGTETETVGTPN